MKRYVLRAIAVTLLVGLTVQAQTYVPSSVRVEFDPGLSFESGEPFEELVIEHYDLYCDGAWVKQVPNDFTRAFIVNIDDIGLGSHTCVLSETVNGVESIASNAMSFDLGQRTPTAPTLTVVAGV